MTNGRATARTMRQPAASTISSTHPSSQPAPYATTARTATVHPLAVNGIALRTEDLPHAPCRMAAGSSTLVEDVVDERGRVDPPELGLRREQHAVAHHGRGDDAHVVGRHERASLGGGQRPGSAHDGDGATGRHAEAQLGHVPRRRAQPHDVAADGVLDVHRLGDLDHRADVARRHHRLQPLRTEVGSEHPQHVDLVVVVRVAERRAHQEAVELGLGQAVRALLLHRVLGGDDDERARHVVADAVDGDVALLHHLEQRGLRLRRGPVDLVGQHDVENTAPRRKSNVPWAWL